MHLAQAILVGSYLNSDTIYLNFNIFNSNMTCIVFLNKSYLLVSIKILKFAA
jgi:hypothetical protein